MYKLSATKREIKGEKVRREGLLPAVIYGAGGETVSLTLAYSEFVKLYDEAGESSLIDLAVENKDAGKVLIHEVQFDPVKGQPIHVDLRRIDMSKPITANVALVFVGEAPAIKELGGTLVKNFEEVEVECLPKDLVNHIDVDLSVLATFDLSIKVSDLKIPSGMTIIEPSTDVVVVKAQPALTEEQIKAMEEESSAAVDVTKIESAVSKKEKEGEEGEAAAAPAVEEKK
ncbi:MAG: 50S ribosomal protein L25 [Candidatus Magasanikbacteria bacterium]|nr:50S ribosomal protein L25 [Candidatus Magasanikbacteria bacterium]